jgi:hypothetical protein
MDFDCEIHLVDGIFTEHCTRPKDASSAKCTRLLAANTSSGRTPFDLPRDFELGLARLLARHNAHARARRRLSHSQVSESPKTAQIMLILTILITLVGCGISCYCCSDGVVEKRFHQQRKPHVCGYLGCPCFTVLGTSIYVIFVLAAVWPAMSAPGPSNSPTGERRQLDVQNSTGGGDAACGLAPHAEARHINMPRAPDGQCCRVGNHPTWVTEMGLPDHLRPFDPESCEAVARGNMESCTSNGSPCLASPPDLAFSTVLSAPALKVRAPHLKRPRPASSSC